MPKRTIEYQKTPEHPQVLAVVSHWAPVLHRQSLHIRQVKPALPLPLMGRQDLEPMVREAGYLETWWKWSEGLQRFL